MAEYVYWENFLKIMKPDYRIKLLQNPHAGKLLVIALFVIGLVYLLKK